MTQPSGRDWLSIFVPIGLGLIQTLIIIGFIVGMKTNDLTHLQANVDILKTTQRSVLQRLSRVEGLLEILAGKK